jgi:predicted nicotinamide N-methyase
MANRLPLLPTNFPLVTAEIDIDGRAWRITAVQNADALLDGADAFEHFPYGFLLWEAAVGLARMLAAEPALVAGKRVLELGAGVGMPGIVARSLGAEVWQTDHQAAALTLAQQNARQNGVDGIMQFLGDWRSWTHLTHYDVILGADIMYERAMFFYLEQIFNRCLAPGGRLLLSDPGRPQALEFAAHLEKHGWRMEMETRTVLLDEQGQENRPIEVALWTAERQ